MSRHAALLAAFLLSLSVAYPASEAAAQCVFCANGQTCTVVTAPGLWSTGCSVTAKAGCQEDLGLCYIHPREAMRDLKLRPSDLLHVDTPAGRLALAPIGESRYAAWDCKGRLIHLARKDEHGKVVPLNPAPVRASLTYSRVVARRGASPTLARA